MTFLVAQLSWPGSEWETLRAMEGIFINLIFTFNLSYVNYIFNLKRYLPKAWHEDQASLLKQQIERYDDRGIKYVLPAFSGICKKKKY